MAILSNASRIVLSIAANEAQFTGSKYIEVEHLFLGLCKIEDILPVGKIEIPNLTEFQWIKISEEIKKLLNFFNKFGIKSKRTRRRLRAIVQDSEIEKGKFSGHRTDQCKKVFKDAEVICNNEADQEVNLMHFLEAILNQESAAINMLFSELFLNKNSLLEGLEKYKPEDINNGKSDVTVKKKPIGKEGKESYQLGKTRTPFLDKYGRDITKLASEGKLDPTIGRLEEIKKIAQILIQKKKNNPILVGDAGVGKTCIVEGFAKKITEPNISSRIKDFRVIELSMGSLVAGTKYRGEFEEKLQMLIKEASSDPNIVLFIDEIHTVVGAGATGEGAMDAGNILKPALARGEIKCIGATTTKEYRKYIEKDSALERRFQIVWVDEPIRKEAVLILKGLRPKFEKYHMIKIPDEVIEKTIELSMRYLTDFRLPDKAIDIIDQACSQRILKSFSQPKTKKKNTDSELSIDDIAKIISEKCRVPVNNLTSDESKRLLKMEEYIKKRVIGQDDAIKEVSETIRASKAGLKDPRRPASIFLFLGSTGVGKTETAKALAEFLFHDENKLITIDMSEYKEKHSISKLIGAPPGYVGYDQEGILTSKVRKDPYSVILFDDVEKASSEIFEIFLQIFDEGRLTDAHGRNVNFSEAIIILTSNLGSEGLVEKDKYPLGLVLEKNVKKEKSNKWKDYKSHVLKVVSNSIKPEILNRIQKKIIFHLLSRRDISLILGKLLDNLNRRIESKKISILLEDKARDFLVDNGYSKENGARMMERVFDKYISEPLSKEILKGNVKTNHVVKIGVIKDKLNFKVE